MSDRVAILVIHGMGSQKPYETLDSFARGIQQMLPEENLGAFDSQISFRQYEDDPAHQQKAWTQAFVRLTSRPIPAAAGSPNTPHSVPALIDLVEYYWAPVINGRVKALQSLRFLILSALSPFQYLRANMTVINEVSGVRNPAKAEKIKEEGFPNSRPTQALFILARELYRSVLIFFPMILLCASLYWLLAHPLLSVLTGSGHTNYLSFFWAAPLPNWRDGLVMLAVVLRWLLIGMAIKYLYDGRKQYAEDTLAAKKSQSTWTAAVVLLVALLMAVPFLYRMGPLPTAFDCATQPRSQTGSSEILGVFRWFVHRYLVFAPFRLRLVHLVSYGFLALLIYAINLFLTTAIGDLVVYLGSDTLSTNYVARSQILSECTKTVNDLLKQHADLPGSEGDTQYDRIFIAAHSLGSVIATDVLNDLIAKNRANGLLEDDHRNLRRIAGLFTFGCPLNKVYYFFRSRTNPGTTVLNEILFDLHGFRLRLGMPSATVFVPPFSPNFHWINVWSKFDVISGRMFFYRADKNPEIYNSFEPAQAHTGYWKNPRLYTFFSEFFKPFQDEP